MQIKHLGQVEICLVDTDRALVRLKLEPNLNGYGRELARAAGLRVRHVADVTVIKGYLILEIKAKTGKKMSEDQLRRVADKYLDVLSEVFEPIDEAQFARFTTFPDINGALALHSGWDASS